MQKDGKFQAICHRWGELFLLGVTLVFIFALTYICVKEPAQNAGEGNSYELTAVSLMNDGNAFVSEEDIALAQQMFPDWAENYVGFRASGYQTADGDVVPWYFPSYSASCIPALLILGALGLPQDKAFCYTNLFMVVLLLALVFADRKKLNLRQRTGLIFLFALNPIIFYLNWPSAEVFIFFFVALSALCWATQRRHRAALCIAIAGTMNPCALAMGLVMIAEYLVQVWREGQPGNKFKDFLSNWKPIILYGCCYLPGLVPFAYNYSICGSINLTASHESEIASFADGTVLRQLWAYFTDWNFGLLPYFPLLLAVGLVLAVVAVLRRGWRYLLMLLAMTGMLFGCSFMANINCGMSAIARYGVWAAAVLVVAVGTQAENLLHGLRTRQLLSGVLVCSALYSGAVVLNYGMLDAGDQINSWKITPIAHFVISRWPQLYNPQESVFNTRSNGDSSIGFYYYQDSNMYIRKLYASAADRDTIMANVTALNPEDLEWLDNTLQAAGTKAHNINIPLKYCIYIPVRVLTFGSELYPPNASISADGSVTTAPTAGYSMTGPGEALAAGQYTAVLHYSATDTPCNAQFQITSGRAENLTVLTSAPLTADSAYSSLTFALDTPVDEIDYRVYQEDGTSLILYDVTLTRER